MILSTTIKLRPRLEAQCGCLETAQSESHVATLALGSNPASSHCPGEQVGDLTLGHHRKTQRTGNTHIRRLRVVGVASIVSPFNSTSTDG